MKRSRGFLAICRTLNYFKDSLFLLFWMPQTCHTTGQIYKMCFLQRPARCRRFHSASWVDLTLHVTTSFPGLAQCCSCWSTPLCPSSPSCSRPLCSLALLTLGKAAPQAPLLYARRDGSVNSRWDALCSSQKEASFQRPKAAL